jgi:hypothetical protein
LLQRAAAWSGGIHFGGTIMTEATARHPMTLARIVHRREGMENVEVSRDIEYHVSDGGPLAMDVYHPRSTSGAGAPVVTIVAGYRDVGVPLVLGCRFKEMEMIVSLAQLIAASGIAVVAYSTSDPSSDVFRVLEYLGANGARLGIDSGRMGLWAQSGNVPTALTALMSSRRRPAVKAAVLSNGFMLETGGTSVADAARTYGFATVPAGLSFDDLPADVPLFIARSGLDQFAGLNDSLDAFVALAVKRNLPVTFVNHAAAEHAFELNHDSATTRLIIDSMLAFMRAHLAA